MRGNRVLADSAVTALAPMIWGSTYLVTTQLLPPDRPLLAAVVRALPAGLVLLLFGRVLPKGIWWWRALVLGTLNIGAFFFLLFVSAYHLPGGVAALVGSVQPVITLVLAALVLGDRIRLPHVLACVAATAGVALLVLKATAQLDLVGVLASVGGAICMASGIVLTKRWQRPVNVLLFTGWQLTAGGLVLLPALFLLEGLPSTITGTNALGFGYLIVLGSLFGYSVWFRGTDRVPAIGLSFLGFCSPIVATVLGYVFLGQTLSLLQFVGAAVLIGAIVLVQLTPVRKAVAEPELQRTTS
ncbi:EamA family transporter [Lentzea sp.]|uniref:EamA family transporter n=1 Tax=Lentzea sp. TaxID=56099 RepID=UPI002C8A6EB3|nr:EamA family transporter [Lentzea sp.]HUQ57299.1 EamA family transporter [Lentzea sp.]